MDTTTASMQTLKAWLDAPLVPSLSAYDPVGSLAKITIGWESLEGDIEYPSLAIDAPIRAEREPHAPMIVALLDVEDDETKVDCVVSIASVTQSLMLDLIASSKSERSRVLEALEAGFAGDVLNGESHLCLPSGHHGQRIGYRKMGVRFDDSIRTAGKDEWRATFEVEADLDEIVVARVSRLLKLQVGLAIPPQTFANAEIFTAFDLTAP